MKQLLKTLLITCILFLSTCQLKAQTTDSISKEKAMPYSEIMPEFPGGLDALYKYINKNIVYPTDAIKKQIQGKVIITFVIEIDGSISNLEQYGTPLGYGLDEEAIRLIKSMPKWTPGYQDNKPVPVKFTLPIRFQLN